MSVDAQGKTKFGLAKVRVARKRLSRYTIGGYYVVLDGATIGKVASGRELTSSVEPGRHQLKVRTRDRLSRSRTLEFEVGAGEIAHFECELNGSAVWGWFHALAALLWGRPWIALREVSRPN